MLFQQRQDLKRDLETSLQLGDLAEVAFGRCGRLVAESILMLCILSMVISQMCTVRLIFIIVSYEKPFHSIIAYSNDNNNNNRIIAFISKDITIDGCILNILHGT